VTLSGKSADLANYFLDTSALAKRYHRRTDPNIWTASLRSRVSRLLISNLSIVELESVLAIKTEPEKSISSP